MRILNTLLIATTMALAVGCATTGANPNTQARAAATAESAATETEVTRLVDERQYRAAIAAASQIEDPVARRDSMLRVIEANASEGDSAEATELIYYFEVLQDKFGEAMAYLEIARAQAANGYELASQTYKKALSAARKIEDPELRATALKAIEATDVNVDWRHR